MADRQKKSQVTKLHPEQQQTYENQEALLEKRRRGLKRRLTVFGILAAVILVSLGAILISQMTMLQAKETEKEELQQELQQLNQEEASLKQDIENYNDLDFIAEIAREEYYYTKPGETIYKVPPRTQDNND
ncbi:cell division protein DivIC [Salsuginibacillus halophilus]|uniref:Cell division protein DivIC n=1 Tax=Salsuginibacillus halophilus TaxID=517424 RepID=A0A2P8H7U2_9BACI|nr:septum formation initiator family protein [Salsuginibacillus halophilus]PSL42264.1 cell division protein DivIC [Salsuginibacillus halophilus]